MPAEIFEFRPKSEQPSGNPSPVQSSGTEAASSSYFCGIPPVFGALELLYKDAMGVPPVYIFYDSVPDDEQLAVYDTEWDILTGVGNTLPTSFGPLEELYEDMAKIGGGVHEVNFDTTLPSPTPVPRPEFLKARITGSALSQAPIPETPILATVLQFKPRPKSKIK